LTCRLSGGLNSIVNTKGYVGNNNVINAPRRLFSRP
jgi:hypothetical protein